MKRASIFVTVVVASIACAGVAAGQSKTLKEQLVGTWTLASIVNSDSQGAKSTPWSEHPLGTYMFDDTGHFAEIIIDPDKDGATVDYYGTYTVDEKGQGFILHVVGSSVKRFTGTDTKRDVTAISDVKMETHNATPSVGGGSAAAVWKRAK